MKRFFYFSVSVLCLAITLLIGVYIGGQTVKAQSPDADAVVGYRIAIQGAGGQWQHHYVMLPNGDLYQKTLDTGLHAWTSTFFVGNYWEGIVSTDQSTWGSIKGQFKK